MKNDLDTKIWLSLDSAEHKLRRSAYLATAEPYQEEIYKVIEIIKEIKENLGKKLDKK